MIFRRDREQDPRVLKDPHRLPPGQVLTLKWPVLSYGSPPHYDMAPWRLSLYGDVDPPASLTWDHVRKLPPRARTADMHFATTSSLLGHHSERVASQDPAA